MSGMTRNHGLVYVKSVASTAYSPGDLVYGNGSGAILPASSPTDQLSQAANQSLFAKNFLGVCNGKKMSSDATTTALPVVVGEVVQMACASTTWAVGDLVGAVEASSGTALENQVVAKVTDPAAAIGVCTEAVTSGTKVWFLPFDNLCERSIVNDGYVAQNVRKRFTIAEVNAGATIVPARPGYAFRMVDASAISVGGAAGAVTTVDILGTSTTSRKLVAFAQASLTQSTVLKAGGSGATVLADGASYTANDANTAITIGKTGSNVTTATHIDVVFTFVAERV